MKFMATLKNGMVVGPLVKVESLPYDYKMPGYMLDLPTDRFGYKPNVGCFIGTSGFPETHPFQWYGINMRQISNCEAMDILELTEIAQ